MPELGASRRAWSIRTTSLVGSLRSLLLRAKVPATALITVAGLAQRHLPVEAKCTCDRDSTKKLFMLGTAGVPNCKGARL
jgi:hypothetical protein